VVAGDTLLAASGEALHAVHLPDAEGLWQYEAGPSLRPPVVSEQKVLWLTSSGSEGTLSALDLSTGEELWKAALPGAGGVVVRGDTAYASPASAFDLNSGERLWRSEGVGDSASGGPALSASGDLLFAGTAGGDKPASVVAVDTETGDEIWSVDLEGDAVDPSDRLWVSGGVVVVPLLLGDVVALDAGTGDEVWRYEPPSPRFGNVTVEGGRVWFALQNGEVLALDAGSGEISARSNDYSLNLSGTNLDQRPAFVGGTLVLGVGTYVFGFEPPDGAGGP
jgi:outer membrane protein assembly factor BamB